ncbi:DsrE family protein [Shewanella baltica]|uniref:DsrE family protein n=1 Tax=Shewanella baltica TaxID=62322 RepID=UPI000DF8CF4A|nr:DsrE family protein [Shewanella baltica]SUI46444.1 Uncharacterized conserved protein [Shewanella baltica]
MKSKLYSTKTLKAALCLTLAAIASTAQAGADKFVAGPAIPEFGQIAKVDSMMPIPKDMKFKVAFDMSKAADVGKANRQLESLARFINMHVAAGVKETDIELAMVVHGGGISDLADDVFYAKQHSGAVNANRALVKTLVDHGVKFYICGQSAAYFDLTNASLLPGVDMALSAMTAHAILAQQGYSENPF